MRADPTLRISTPEELARRHLFVVDAVQEAHDQVRAVVASLIAGSTFGGDTYAKGRRDALTALVECMERDQETVPDRHGGARRLDAGRHAHLGVEPDDG